MLFDMDIKTHCVSCLYILGELIAADKYADTKCNSFYGIKTFLLEAQRKDLWFSWKQM